MDSNSLPLLTVTGIGQTGSVDWLSAATHGLAASGTLAGQQELVGSGHFGLISGLLLLGLLGLAMGQEPMAAVSKLADRVERLAQGEDVELLTDRDDDVGRLSRSLDVLVEQLHQQGEGHRQEGDAPRSKHDYERDERRTKREGDRFSALFENTPHAIAQVELTDDDVLVRSVNSRFVETFGCDRDEVRDQSFIDLFLPEIRNRTDAVLQRAREGAHLTREHSKQTPDGKRWFVSQFVPIGTETPITGGYVVYTDVTERKEREQELERYREYTDDILDAIDDIFYVLDEDGTLLRWNDALTEATGYSDDEIAEMHALELFPEDEHETVAESIHKVFEDGNCQTESAFLRKDGTHIPYESVATTLESPDGNRVAAGIARDVTERREHERKLERYREYTDDVLDAIDDIFYVLGEDGTLLRWNETAPDVLGYSEDEIAEMDALEFFPEEERNRITEAINEVFEQGDRRIEVECLTRDGTRIPYEFVGTALEDPEGRPAVAGIGRDVSERNERERRLTEYHEHLQAIVENVPVVLLALDADGTLTLLEGAALETFEPEPDDVVGESVFDALEGYPDLVEPIRRALDGKPVSATTTAGGRFWDSWYEPVTNGEDVERVIGVAIDVTERRQREQDLRERERELSTLMDNIPGMVYRAGNEPDWPFEFVSDGCREVTGYEPDALETGAVSWGEDVITGDGDELWETVQRAIDDREPYRVTFQITTADGETRWVWEQGSAVFDGEGTLQALEGVIIDITDQKRTERELERTRDLLEKAQKLANVGAWETDLTAEPPESYWSDEVSRIHGSGPGESLALDEYLQYIHPDDRSRVSELIETSLETGEPYDFEARVIRDDGDVRWVHVIGEPIEVNGEPALIRGAIQDVTERKARELALESLQETTQNLLGAETTTEVAQLVVDSAGETLGVPGIAVYLLDEETNQLEPAASTPAFVDLYGDAESVPIDQGDSVLWSCFVAGEPQVLDDDSGVSRSFSPTVEEGLVVPIADYGVFVLVASEPALDDDTRRLAETFVATTEAALDRLESEAILRKRESELASRNRRLRRQGQVNTIIRSIHQSLIGADTREEVERVVCERLVEAESVSFAWTGTLDTKGEGVELRAWAGTGQDYLDEGQFSLGGETEPAVVTAESGTPTVVSNVVEGLGDEDWRQRALLRNFHSVVSVPLSFDDFSFGVLTVYADEPDAFTDLERAVFTELGESIANAITTVQTRRALHADTQVELTLRTTNDSFLTRVAQDADCEVEYEGLAVAADSTNQSRLFFTTTGAETGAVLTVLDDLVSVTGARLVSEREDESLFEVTVASETLPGRLIRHGGNPRSIHAVDEALELVVDVPTSTDIREFVEMLEQEHSQVELLGRRDVERSMQTRQEFLESLLDGLTERQREVLTTAYYAGFFEWPRTSTGEEIAEMLDVTQPTVNRHLRLSQQRLLERLFDEVVAVGE